MKHVFLIHSSITYIATLSIIAYEEFKPENCLILCEKDLDFDEVLPIVFMPKEKDLNSKTISAKKIRKYIDKRNNNDDFTLYIPVMSLLARMIVTHNKCKKFCFFEEGVSAYNTNYNLDYITCEYYMQKNWTLETLGDHINLLRRIVGLFLRGITIKLLSLPFHYIEYTLINSVTFYCLTEKTFPMAKNKKIISMHNQYTKLLKPFWNLDNSYIWVSSEFYKNDFDESQKTLYKDRLREFLNNNKVDNVYIKYHQGESDYSRKLTLEIFDEIGVKYIVLPDKTLMEIEILNAKNVTMIGDYSSLLMYNTEFGHKSVSVTNDVL